MQRPNQPWLVHVVVAVVESDEEVAVDAVVLSLQPNQPGCGYCQLRDESVAVQRTYGLTCAGT